MYSVSFPKYKLFQKCGAGYHIYNGVYTLKHDHKGIWECFMLTKGPCRHIANGQSEIIDEYRLFLMRPDDYHYFTTVNGAFTSHICTYITEAQMRALCDCCNSELYDTLLQYPQLLQITLNETQNAEILNMLQRLQMTGANDFTVLSTLIRMFFAHIIRLIYTEYVIAVPRYPEPIRTIVQRMESKQYIAANVEGVCHDISYSRMQLSRLFKQHTGTTMISYFKQVKLNYACNLLETTNYSMLDISNAIGFTSLSHLTHEFNKTFGMPPLKYRQQHNRSFAVAPNDMRYIDQNE